MTDASNLPEMPCRDLVEVVTSYLDDALSADDRARFEAHLEICEACVMYVDQVRETIRLAGRAVPAEELPADLRAGLQAAFRDWAA